MNELLKELEEIEVGQELTKSIFRRNIYKLVPNEGFWLTDIKICATSGFAENSIYTTVPDHFGTVTESQKNRIEEIQAEIYRLKEAGEDGTTE